MIKEIVGRLRLWAVDVQFGRKVVGADQDLLNAADLIEQQAAEIERLREALKPFAECPVSDEGVEISDLGPEHFSTARRILEETK